MAKTYTGIDIGSSSVKLAGCTGGTLRRAAVSQLPENVVRDGVVISPEVMSGIIKEASKAAGVSRRDSVVSLPEALAFFHRLTMPAMTIDQLKINLPYEFRDYITKDKDQYFYDYSVVKLTHQEDGTPLSLDLMAAAVSKETIQGYMDLFRKAGFRLKGAVPEEFAFSNLIRDYEARTPGQKQREYCILDLGHHATRVHIFTGPSYETSRAIECGGAMLDAAIAEYYSINQHVARTYKHSNHENALYLDACKQLYQRIAVEVMRAINFYSFNNPSSNLKDVYLCGGGALIAPLREQLASTLEAEIHSIAALIKAENNLDESDLVLCPVAIGAAIGMGGGQR